MKVIEFIILNIDDIDKIGEKSKEILNKICNNENDCYWELEINENGDAHMIKGLGSPSDYNIRSAKSKILIPGKKEVIIVGLRKYEERIPYRI